MSLQDDTALRPEKGCVPLRAHGEYWDVSMPLGFDHSRFRLLRQRMAGKATKVKSAITDLIGFVLNVAWSLVSEWLGKNMILLSFTAGFNLYTCSVSMCGS